MRFVWSWVVLPAMIDPASLIGHSARQRLEGRVPDATTFVPNGTDLRTEWYAAHGARPVSYTHLDVYKRQPSERVLDPRRRNCSAETLAVFGQRLDHRKPAKS